MRKQIEAPTLEEAYKIASKELNCSITDLEVEILQNPSKGFLGIGKKNAIILASCKNKKLDETKEEEPIKTVPKKEVAIQEVKKETLKKKIEKESKTKIVTKEEIKKDEKTIEPKEKKTPSFQIDDKFEDFYKEKRSIDEIAKIVEDEVNELFKYSCFDLEKIKVSPYDENSLLFEFSGKDSALLIGKEGYRYKALSYMLFNWINPKYDLQIRLEIAEFLKTQEEMVKKYLKPLIEKIKEEGRGQTKPLDGVLAQIALKVFLEIF
ncbi:MAG TPA: protein jag [Campylobacterales bacterium]|nr:protein jag [Campylobacterales bacterium]